MVTTSCWEWLFRYRAGAQIFLPDSEGLLTSTVPLTSLSKVPPNFSVDVL